ncbi:MAG: hypothetical protein FVQ83_06315 [Chloroflexi bacterium]|nr:hypothetical protein [Chloroflexota bacterium]
MKSTFTAILLCLVIAACGQTETATPPTTPQSTIGVEETPEPIISPSPTTSPASPPTELPFSGAIRFANDAEATGGTAGETIDIYVTLEAESPFGEITQMRVAGIYGGGCLLEEDLTKFSWEPFTEEKRFSVGLAINWIGFYVTAQFADEHGNASPIYCADISVEGMPSLTPSD